MFYPMDDSQKKPVERPVVAAETVEKPDAPQKPKPKEFAKEFGGPAGPEPTRYGDWERKGICVDF